MTAPNEPSVERRPSRTPRVVVSGIGLVTGLGLGREPTWSAIREGRHAFRFLDLPVAPGTPPFAGGPIPHSDHRALETLVKAVIEARRDARLDPGSFDPARAATVVGMSKGDLGRLAAHHRDLLRGDRDGSHWDRWIWAWPDGGARAASAATGFRGPCLAPVAACATGLIAALQGVALIRRGACDLAVIGAGDSSLDPLVLGAFRRMGVLARVGAGDDPGRALRPWDAGRSGFLVGEGAAILVLEREEHARARGVVPYAELAGGASGADAYHLTDLNPDPANLAGVIGRALADAGVTPDEVDHANVHGTATRTNDPLECRALRLALGPAADGVACSASKAQIGHLLGAAGAAELALTCLAVRDGFVPPTLNLDDPDPACDLDGTPHVGRPRAIRAALKLSIGFGGHLAVAVVRGWEIEEIDPRIRKSKRFIRR
jgi:3-oxoacyl-[acyl-carrier-protein] synthase II